MVTTVRGLFRRKFVRDTLVLQAGKIFNVGISFAASVLIARLMQPTAYGEWALTTSFFAIWQSLNLTGVTHSTMTRLSAAVGARDAGEIINLMAFHVWVSVVWAVVCFTLLVVLGAPIAAQMYTQDVHLLSSASFPVVFSVSEPTIGFMAALYSLALLPDAIYVLVGITLQSRRLMWASAVLANVNQIMLTACVLVALIISPTLPGMVAGRLAYSFSSMLVGVWVYTRQRDAGSIRFPAITAIVARALTVPLRPYLQFGFVISLDRTVANLFIQIAMQVVGVNAGKEAAGYLQLALKAMQLPNTLTSALFDNMQAVVPQAVGRRDFGWLWRNFNRVLLTLGVGSLAFYTVVAVVVLTMGNFIVPLLYGNEWTPAVPLLAVLAIYGAVTTVGGIFGPLYRALNLVGKAAILKAVALALSLLPGLWLVDTYGDIGGAWMISLVYAISIALTALLTLPALRQRAFEVNKHDAEAAAS